MRTLVIAAEYPWPTNSGSRLRLANTIDGLASLGPVDLFSIVSSARADFEDVEASEKVKRSKIVAIDDRGSARAVLRAVANPAMPLEIPLRDEPRVSKAASDFARGGDYDLVWCFRVRSWVLAGKPRLGPTVVDLDDLEDLKIRARIESRRLAGRSLPGTGRHLVGDAFWRSDARRWRRLHAQIARRTEAAVVCSALDEERAGVSNLHVVPNGYEPPKRPVGRLDVGFPPTVVFHGTLRYPPNADGARFLVDEVVPELRRLVPDIRIRLVGLESDAVRQLAAPPLVTVTGQVPDITTELARADAVVVPLRFASGTRVKVLEAFAHRIPVVSTTVGAEGLDAVGGVHLVLADSAPEIAQACASVLRNRRLRAQLVDDAQRLFCERYRSAVVRDAVSALAEKVASS